MLPFLARSPGDGAGESQSRDTQFDFGEGRASHRGRHASGNLSRQGDDRGRVLKLL